jgi:hypothetical protein
MKANELRIGNYVVPPVGCEPHIGEITAINLDRYDCELIDDNYEEYVSISQFGKIRELNPVPITKEWLLKFGFKEFIDFGSKSGIYEKLPLCGFTYSLNTKKIMILHKGNAVSHWLDIQTQYVHQLQNLYFALTGEELTYGGTK